MDQPNPTVQPTENNTPTPPPVQGGPERGALWVVLTYILFFVPLLKDNMKNDPFYKFHMRQSLGFLLCWLVINIFDRVPVFGWFVPFIALGLLILWVISAYHATQGKMEKTPLIGEYFAKLPL